MFNKSVQNCVKKIKRILQKLFISPNSFPNWFLSCAKYRFILYAHYIMKNQIEILNVNEHLEGPKSHAHFINL